MSGFLLHQFSPQRTEPAILKETLVSRSALLDEVLDKIRGSASTSTQHHFLLIGPRGIGKTNFLTLVHHELTQSAATTPQLRLAWLNEDEISATFLLLLRRIYRALASAYPKEYPPTILDTIQGQSQEVAFARLTDALTHASVGKKVLILIENLDEHFSKMKSAEQMRWRAFLQNHKEFVTLASAQKLTAEISKRAKPFFNFFDVRTLQPLSVEEAKELLIRIATLRNDPQDPQMIEFLNTARGLGRLRAIHKLAGGNPRLYVLFSELITPEELDDVVVAFEEMVDRQLTTYYQERLRWVSGQQQEIIRELCRARAPISVNRIAEGIFATNQTVSRQLKDLSSMGYVQSHSLGRESVYELAEPLMRLVLEAKQGSGRGQLKVIVEFLRLWFEPQELRQKLELCQSDLSKSYYEEALQGTQNLETEIDWSQIDWRSVPQKVHELAERLKTEEDSLQRIALLTEMLETPGLPHSLVAFLLVARAAQKLDPVVAGSPREIQTYLDTVDVDGALKDLEEALQFQAAPPVRVCLYEVRSTACRLRGDREGAIRNLTEAIDLASPLRVSKLRISRAQLYAEVGNTTAADADLHEVLQTSELSIVLKTNALLVRGQAFAIREAWPEAISTWDTLLQLETLTPEQRWELTHKRAEAVSKSDAHAALDGINQAVALAASPAQKVRSLAARAMIHEQNGDRASAFEDLESTVSLPDVSAWDRIESLLLRYDLYKEDGKYDLAMADANEAVKAAEKATSWALTAYRSRGTLHERMGRLEEALADYDAGLACRPTALIPANPVWRRSLALVRGAVLLRLSRSPEAKTSLEQALSSYVQGPFIEKDTRYQTALDILFAQEPGSTLGTIQKLVSVAATAKELGKLGTALVLQLSSFRTEKASPSTLQIWGEAWAQAGADREELVVPLRLLQAGLKYLAEPHEKFLLTLPLEERQLLREALGLK